MATVPVGHLDLLAEPTKPAQGSGLEKLVSFDLFLKVVSPPSQIPVSDMQAIQIRKLEGPDKLLDNISLVTDLPIPSPGPGEVLIRLHVRPIDPADIFSLMGVYPGFSPTTFPAVPGLEGAGVVEQVGEGVSEFSKGQRVTPFLLVEYTKKGNGSWQEYVVVKVADVIAVPDDVSDASASQFVVNPLTVVGMLRTLNAPAGEYVLQTAAGSVLGRQFIAVAKHLGVKTINIVRRSAQIQELKSLGADEVLCSTEVDVAARVKEITGGKGAYGAIECVGGDLFATVASCVRDEGQVLLYGAMSGLTFSVGIPDVLFRYVSVRGFWVSPYVQKMSSEEKLELFTYTMKLLEDKVIEPFSGQTFKLSEFADAVKKQNTEGRGGKFLLVD